MVLPADQAPPGPDYLLRRFADLERRIRELEGERRLPSSQVGAGGGMTVAGGGQLLVKHTNGATLLQAGPGVDAGGNPVEQVIMRRPDGTVAFWCYGSSTSLGFTALYDRAGNLLWADDPVVGQGLSKPYFPCGSFESMSTPTDSTSGGSFVGLQKAVWRKQHPRIRPVVLAQVTSTTAEIRWTITSGPDTGAVIGGPVVLNNGTGYAYYGPFTVPGAHLSEFEIDLEGRVASGVGAVAVRTLHAIGIQA